MQPLIVLISLTILIIALYSSWARPSVLLLIVIQIFLISHVLTPEDVLKGLANKQIATIFLLVALVSCFRKAFGNYFFSYLFKPSLKPKQFLVRMMLFVGSISPFINNTPIIAFMVPYVKEWLDEKGWPVSKFMIPLCYATVLSGMITVIGTSSNLVLAGLISEAALPALGFRDFLFPGLLVTITGTLYLYSVGYWLLPSKISATAEMEHNFKEYVVETVVSPKSHFIGETIASAHLRNLKDIYLFGIHRQGIVLSPVAPEETVCAGDHLFFAGRTHAIAQLMKNGNGLLLPDVAALTKYNHRNCIEAIVPANSSLVGKKVKETDFRRRFNATIIALHRDGRRMTGPLGEAVLSAGDLLLLLGAEKVPNNSDIFLLNHPDVDILSPSKSVLSKAVSLSTFILLVLGITGVMDLFMSALIGILLFFAVKTVKLRDIKSAFDFDLAVLLVASLAIGLALTKSGAAQTISGFLIRISGTDPYVSIALLFVATLLVTSVITNAATVAIFFPLAVSLADSLQIPTAPVFVAVAFAATCTFLSPIGYQCNLMVYGPGNYTFKDFFKVGLPLTLIYSGVCLLFIFWYYKI